MSKPDLAPRLVEHDDPEAKREWARYLSSGMDDLITSYNLVHGLFALVDSGMAARMSAPASVDQICAGLDRDMGHALLRFAAIRGIAMESEGRYALTERGRALTAEMPFAELGFYREAYGPVLDRMSQLLRGTVKYPTDVQRNGEALGRHCTSGFHYYGTSVAIAALDVLGAKSFLDLGCGGGGFLIDACKARPTMRGVGLDISDGAIAFARKSVANASLGERIQLVVGDAFRPDTWPAACRETDAIITVGTMHEQFRDGEDAVVALLDTYHALMVNGPMKGMVLGEPEVTINQNDVDFYVMHVFTKQGLPRARAGWLPVFEKSKLRCEAVLTAPGTGPSFCYYVLKPR